MTESAAVHAQRVVVAAALIESGHLLAARRSAPADLAGFWELPGGKIEPGESPTQAVTRELREELGVEAHALHRIPGEHRLTKNMVLRAWRVCLRQGDPQPLQDHDRLRWLSFHDLYEVPWLPQDLSFVEWVSGELRREEACTQ
ncbi:(deoxy)nucleoside triphosphate pyrophosphohydrolase [Streptomyces reniochalinae]|uniref:8-oxo-dGTP diphosphatase n=1 Tax=Streptomyces reniochalinae TaxID=2250578 RepID=A0A367E688_9ACTN|nr:(deoxy)nucleoside triphosphate pyrophosphohydrolase [Streptomyces reniochalinae]RCG13576.1 (deoxy)nucleoside triphosphate pyrophosphohydrolase [Streptomyces reniochalinae]